MANPTEEQLLIKQFIEKIYGTNPEIALEYLTRRKWNLQDAMAKFLEDIIDQSESPAIAITIDDFSSSSSRFDPTLSPKEAAESLALMGLSQVKESDQEKDKLINRFCEMTGGGTQAEAITYLKRFNWAADRAANFFLDHPSHGEFSEKDTHETMQMNLQENRGNQGHLNEGNIGSSSSSSFIADPAETGSSFNEAGLVNVHGAGHGIATSQVANQLPKEPPSQEKDKLINTFCNATGGGTRGEAIAYLSLCDWNIRDAVIYFFDQDSLEMKAENRGLPSQLKYRQASLGSPNQGYLKKGEIGSSTSLVIADLTKTGSPFKEAGPGIAKSQVVKNGKPEAVDEDSSIETGSDPLASQDRSITTKITFLVVLDDGGKEIEVYMTFRSDETLRDIRNRIAEFGLPDDNRGYYLTSRGDTTEKYDDLNTTVQRIYSRGATELLQVFPDS